MTAEKTLAEHAEAAYQDIRAIAALTVFRPVLPAPDLYPTLGSLALLGHSLHQALGQLADGLERSPGFFDLREDDPERDPAVSIAEGVDWLATAAEHAVALGHTLGNAQAAITGQGWHPTTADQDEAGDLTDPEDSNGDLR